MNKDIESLIASLNEVDIEELMKKVNEVDIEALMKSVSEENIEELMKKYAETDNLIFRDFYGIKEATPETPVKKPKKRKK